MDMVLGNEFLEMNPMELGDVSGGALNALGIMYVSPDTPRERICLPVVGMAGMLGVVAALECFQAGQ